MRGSSTMRTTWRTGWTAEPFGADPDAPSPRLDRCCNGRCPGALPGRRPTACPPTGSCTSRGGYNAPPARLPMVVPVRELDLLTCPVLHRHLIKHRDCGTCRVLVIDFTRVQFLGAAGLRVLVEVARVPSCAWWSAFGRCGVRCGSPKLAGKFTIHENLVQAVTKAPSSLETGRGGSR